MSKQQWGHGFNKGREAGHDEGYERGKNVPAMMEAEQIDCLVEMLASMFAEDGASSRQWATLRTISMVNSENMLSPGSAWHNRFNAQSRSCSDKCSAEPQK